MNRFVSHDPEKGDVVWQMQIPEQHYDQYKMLRAEALTLVDESRKIETAVVIAVATLYAWLATHRLGLEPIHWGLGFLLSTLGGVRCLAIYMRIQQIAGYLRAIEDQYLKGNTVLKGWENHVKDKYQVMVTGVVFWVLLWVVTAVVPCNVKTTSGDTDPPAPVIQILPQPAAPPAGKTSG